MKTWAFFLSVMSIFAGSSVHAASNNQGAVPAKGQTGAAKNSHPSCSELTPDEQNFANQLKNRNNQMMFCSQFTPEQRTQAMQLMGNTDARGNQMNADGAVERVLQINQAMPATIVPNARKPAGTCPVK